MIVLLRFEIDEKGEGSLLADIRLTPPRRARRLMAGLVMPWMLSRRILRWRLAPPLPRPFPPFPPRRRRVSVIHWEWRRCRVGMESKDSKVKDDVIVDR